MNVNHLNLPFFLCDQGLFTCSVSPPNYHQELGGSDNLAAVASLETDYLCLVALFFFLSMPL